MRNVGFPIYSSAVRRIGCRMAIAGFALASAFVGSASAATIVVDTTVDSFDSGIVINPPCSLRDAIQAAKTAAAFGGCNAGDPMPATNVTMLAPGVYDLGVSGADEDANHSGDFDIRSNMLIRGPLFGTSDQVIIDAYVSGTGDRIFDIRNATVALSGLTLRGYLPFNAASTDGGAVLVMDAAVTIDNCVIRDSQAPDGGGIYVGGSNSQVTVTHSAIVNNEATQHAGGGVLLAAPVLPNTQSLELRATTVSGNFASAEGGGIAMNGGALTLNNVTIAYNEANYPGVTSPPSTGGGGVYIGRGTAMATNSIIADNRSHSLSGHDCDGTFTNFEFNLISDSAGCNVPDRTVGNLFDREPYLAPLFDYGNHTPAHHPRYNSPVIYAGSDGIVPGEDCESQDQRFASGQGICDMGAVQWHMDFIVDGDQDEVDDNPGDGICHTASNHCSLRAALMEANRVPGSNSFSSILLPAHTLDLGIPGRDEIQGAQGDLNIQHQVNIFGTVPLLPIGHAAVDANGLDRVFDVSADAALVDFDIRGGDTLGNNASNNRGGGLLVENIGNVLLSRAQVSGNIAAGGGGIHVGGRLHADHCAISANTAATDQDGGGGVELGASGFEVTISNCTIGHNMAAGAGGGIYATNKPLRISNSTIAFNESNTDLANLAGGGGIRTDPNATQVYVSDTILAHNHDGQPGAGYAPSDCSGKLQLLNRNLVETTIGCTFNSANGLSVLDPLLLNNPAGDYFPLLQASPAYQAVPNQNYPNSQCRGDPVAPARGMLQLSDQLDHPRPAGDAAQTPCSLGAYEGVDPDHIFVDGFEGA